MNEELSKEQLSESMALPDVRRVLDALRSSDEATALAAKERILRGLSSTALAALIESNFFDTPTQLGSKHALSIVINESIISNRNTLVVMTDLVKFKPINELYGHTVGDRIIAAAAQAFSRTLRSETETRYGDDIMYELNDAQGVIEGDGYRFGGDEFVAILRNGDGLKIANHEEIVRSKLTAVLSDESLLRVMHEFGISEFGIRAGYSFVDPTVHKSSEDIIDAADPKTALACQYSMQRTPEGIYVIVAEH